MLTETDNKASLVHRSFFIIVDMFNIILKNISKKIPFVTNLTFPQSIAKDALRSIKILFNWVYSNILAFDVALKNDKQKDTCTQLVSTMHSFASGLIRVFPYLQWDINFRQNTPLPEDIDLKGFSPLEAIQNGFDKSISEANNDDCEYRIKAILSSCAGFLSVMVCSRV